MAFQITRTTWSQQRRTAALPDHTETPRALRELQGNDPMILTLPRGHYCPKEHQQHRELAAHYPKIAVAYPQVVTIATGDHHALQEFGRRPADLPGATQQPPS
jgi:peroxiredoxin